MLKRSASCDDWNTWHGSGNQKSKKKYLKDPDERIKRGRLNWVEGTSWKALTQKRNNLRKIVEEAKVNNRLYSQ